MMPNPFLILLLFDTIRSEEFGLSLRRREKIPQPIGELCVDNDDCVSNCCLYVQSITGKCVEKAPLSHVRAQFHSLFTAFRDCEVCGFLKTSSAGSLSAQLYYRLCSVRLNPQLGMEIDLCFYRPASRIAAAETAAVPASFCVTVLELSPEYDSAQVEERDGCGL